MLRCGRPLHYRTWRTRRLCVFIRIDAKVAEVREEETGRPFQNKIVTVYEFTVGQMTILLFQDRLITVHVAYFNFEHVVKDCLAFFVFVFSSSDKTKPVLVIIC